jgi:hypothetical protein
MRIFVNPLMFMLLGGICLSLTPADNNNRSSNQPSVRGVRPGISDDSSQSERSNRSERSNHRSATREEIAQAERGPYARDGHFRMGDWDYRENWRYERDAYYGGKTQPQAYREDHPYGPGGIGFDPDINFGRNLRRYEDLFQKEPTTRNREELENYVNPYHVRPYRGNYGEGSYNDAFDRGY